MTTESSSPDLVPVFMPALVTLLVSAEDKKGAPLTRDEVHAIRDKGTCIMMEVADARKMDESRDYRDVDPENCWYDWQMARREMGREPELNPGPRFGRVRSSDADYQQTIADAQASLATFGDRLPADGSPSSDALIKTRLVDGENSAFMWLNLVAIDGDGFTAELFEVPDTLARFKIGERLRIEREDLLDWMINDDGRLSGGYSLRYQRARLSETEQAEFDQHIGVTEYL